MRQLVQTDGRSFPLSMAIQQLFVRIKSFRPITVITQLWPFLKTEWRRLLDATGTTLLLTGVEVSTPVLIGIFVDMMWARLAGAPILNINQYGIIALLIVGVFARGLLLTRQQALGGEIGERTAANLRIRLWSHLQQVPLDYIRQRGPGRLSLRFLSDTRMIQRLVTQGMVRLSQDMLLLIAIAGVLLVINWRMALGVLVVFPAYVVIFSNLNPKLRRASRQTRRRRSRLSAYLYDRMTGMVAIKASGRQPTESETLRSLSRSLASRGARRARIGGQVQGYAASAVAAGSVLVLVLAAVEIAAGRLSAGMFVTFYTMLGLIVPVFQRIAVANRYYQEASISLDNVMRTFSVQSEIMDDLQLPDIKVDEGSVMVKGVSFKHKDGPKVLSNVSFEAHRGELVALVGPNGAGKSSLIELLLRFRKPSEGRVCIDRQDISKVSLTSLRSHIGLVSQDAPLLDGTIAQNIAYGVQDGAPEEQILRAAQLSGLDRVVATLPDGWDTKVGAGGKALSGGQRQLIALARALASDPPILILDEATSALDAETEQMLAERLRELAEYKTVIASAHRLPTLLVADRIYVLQQGHLMEEGTHRSLLEQNGIYTRLFGEERVQTHV